MTAKKKKKKESVMTLGLKGEVMHPKREIKKKKGVKPLGIESKL